MTQEDVIKTRENISIPTHLKLNTRCWTINGNSVEFQVSVSRNMKHWIRITPVGNEYKIELLKVKRDKTIITQFVAEFVTQENVEQTVFSMGTYKNKTTDELNGLGIFKV